MAINNGRYVVTGGYMDPNGNIVEETQWAPDAVTSSPSGNVSVNQTPYFPRAEAYGIQAQGYANQGNDAMAKAYGGLASDLGSYSNFANTSIGAADSLLNYLRQNETGLQSAAGTLYNQLTGDIQNQRDYINRMFGPEGELTQEVNRYYDDLGNYLSTEAGRQAANIAAQGVHSGASLGSIRAQQNEAYNEAFSRYVQAKEQQINAKQQIAANLINYMSTLRQEYGDTTNQYIIELYKRANDLYNGVAQSVASDIDQYNMLRARSSGTGGGSGVSTQDSISSILGNSTQGGEMGVGGGITTPAGQGGATNQGGTTTSNSSSRTTPNYLGTAAMLANPLFYGVYNLSNYLGNQASNLVRRLRGNG